MIGVAQKQRPHVHTSARQTAARFWACPGALATARSHVRRLTEAFSSSLLRLVSNAYVSRAVPSTPEGGCFPPFPRLLARSPQEGGVKLHPRELRAQIQAAKLYSAIPPVFFLVVVLALRRLVHSEIHAPG